MRALLLGLGFVFALFPTDGIAAEDLDFPVLKTPKACQCYPASALSKKYVSEGHVYPNGRWKVFTCEFYCDRGDGTRDRITGTQRDSYRIKESGKNFVCRGYKMEWIESTEAEEWGYYTIEGIVPFNARGSRIPELEAWAQTCR